MVGVEFEDFKDGLGVLGIVFAGNGGGGEELCPLVWEAGECSADRVESNMDFVDKVGGVAYSHERRSVVYLILPSV